MLNDFLCLDLKTGLVSEITAKGGFEMFGKIFKAIQLEGDNYAFFSDVFDHFFIFNLLEKEFTKVEIMLFQPLPRENYIVHKFPDGRVMFFGGGNKEKCYNDLFYLMEYSFDEKIHYGWNSIDTFGSKEEGYFGHASILLQNDNILIHGGVKRSFDIINIKQNQFDPHYTKRFKIIDITNNYKYVKSIKPSNSSTLIMQTN